MPVSCTMSLPHAPQNRTKFNMNHLSCRIESLLGKISIPQINMSHVFEWVYCQARTTWHTHVGVRHFGIITCVTLTRGHIFLLELSFCTYEGFSCRFYLFKIIVCGSFVHFEYLNGCDMRGGGHGQDTTISSVQNRSVFLTYDITTCVTPHNCWGPQKMSST